MEMLNYIINEELIKRNVFKSEEEVRGFHAEFYNNIGARYKEYKNLLLEDVSDTVSANTIHLFQKTLMTFSKLVFKDPIESDKIPSFVVQLTLVLATMLKICIHDFK
jgi:hypothetical protein